MTLLQGHFLYSSWQNPEVPPNLIQRNYIGGIMERRHFLALWTLLFAPSLKAKTPMRPTPAQTEGPFYPVVDIPLRQNLILQSEGLVGEPIVLQGRVVDTSGKPCLRHQSRNLAMRWAGDLRSS